MGRSPVSEHWRFWIVRVRFHFVLIPDGDGPFGKHLYYISWMSVRLELSPEMTFEWTVLGYDVVSVLITGIL
jgi:hypothetical protein